MVTIYIAVVSSEIHQHSVFSHTLFHDHAGSDPVVIAIRIFELHDDPFPIALMSSILLEVDIVDDSPGIVTSAEAIGVVRRYRGEWFTLNVVVTGVRATPLRLRGTSAGKLADIAVICSDTVGLVTLAVFGGGRHAGTGGHIPHGSCRLSCRETKVIGEGRAGDGIVGKSQMRQKAGEYESSHVVRMFASFRGRCVLVAMDKEVRLQCRTARRRRNTW